MHPLAPRSGELSVQRTEGLLLRLRAELVILPSSGGEIYSLIVTWTVAGVITISKDSPSGLLTVQLSGSS